MKRRNVQVTHRRAPKIYGNLTPQVSRRVLPRISRRALLGILGFGVLLYVITLSPLVRVGTARVTAPPGVDVNQVLALVPTGNVSIWSYPEAEVESKLLAAFPHLSAARVQVRPAGVAVRLAGRGTVLIWKAGETSYLVDGQGVAHALATGEEAVPVVTDTTGLAVQPGSTVAPMRFLRFVQQWQVAATAQGFPEQRVYRVGASTLQVEVEVQPEVTALLPTSGSADVLARNLARLRDAGALSGATSVDLRVDRWAFTR